MADAQTETAETKECSRCGEPRAGLARAPYPGKVGRELQESVCEVCWREWQAMEVMVINELRLNFMEPQSMEILAGEARKFFQLDGDREAFEDPRPESERTP